MKKTQFLPAVLLSILVSAGNYSQAQYTESSIQLNAAKLESSAKGLFDGEEADRAALTNMKLANPKMHRDFTRFFAHATDIRVAESKNHVFVSCKVDGIMTRVMYTSKGRWLNSLKYLSPLQIPADVSAVVLNAFPRQSIRGATEVRVGNKIAHLVSIEDAKSHKTIRVIDGEYDIYKEFSK